MASASLPASSLCSMWMSHSRSRLMTNGLEFRGLSLSYARANDAAESVNGHSLAVRGLNHLESGITKVQKG